MSGAGLPVKSVLAPDPLVTLDHELEETTTCQIWAEGRLPDCVLEVVSLSSLNNDKKLSKDKYERLGIPGDLLDDPDAKEPKHSLLSYRLDTETGKYSEPLKSDAEGSIQTAMLGVPLRVADSRLVIAAHSNAYGGEASSMRSRCRRHDSKPATTEPLRTGE